MNKTLTVLFVSCCVGAVVGAVAHRTVVISRCVSVCHAPAFHCIRLSPSSERERNFIIRLIKTITLLHIIKMMMID